MMAAIVTWLYAIYLEHSPERRHIIVKAVLSDHYHLSMEEDKRKARVEEKWP